MNDASEPDGSGGFLPVPKVIEGLEWLYDRAVDGFTGVAGAEDFARSYRERHASVEEAIDSLISWQMAKAGGTGFVTGLGGVLTLPVSIPANVAGVLYLQLQMIAAIAHLRGHNLRDHQVRTLAFLCLAGSSAFDVLKDVGLQVGTKLSRQMILKISGATLRRINQAVGFRLVTKAGSTGVINLVKFVPVVGGVVGGGLDAAMTGTIGHTAKRVFGSSPEAEPPAAISS
jgi:hypothetical protein